MKPYMGKILDWLVVLTERFWVDDKRDAARVVRKGGPPPFEKQWFVRELRGERIWEIRYYTRSGVAARLAVALGAMALGFLLQRLTGQWAFFVAGGVVAILLVLHCDSWGGYVRPEEENALFWFHGRYPFSAYRFALHTITDVASGPWRGESGSMAGDKERHCVSIRFGDSPLPVFLGSGKEAGDVAAYLREILGFGPGESMADGSAPTAASPDGGERQANAFPPLVKTLFSLQFRTGESWAIHHYTLGTLVFTCMAGALFAGILFWPSGGGAGMTRYIWWIIPVVLAMLPFVPLPIGGALIAGLIAMAAGDGTAIIRYPLGVAAVGLALFTCHSRSMSIDRKEGTVSTQSRTMLSGNVLNEYPLGGSARVRAAPGGGGEDAPWNVYLRLEGQDVLLHSRPRAKAEALAGRLNHFLVHGEWKGR